MTPHGKGLSFTFPVLPEGSCVDTVGEPANITLVDPQAPVTVDRDASVSLSRNNPWHGRSLTGAVHATFLRGRPTVLGGQLALVAQPVS